MVDFTGFLEHGFDESYAIYAQIYQIHYCESKTLSTICTIHQETCSDKEKYVGNKHDFDAPYDEIEKKGWTTFYGRDRNDKGNMSHQYKNREEYGKKGRSKFGTEYHYVFSLKDKKWSYYDYNGKEKIL